MALIESYEGDQKVSIDPFYLVRKILKIPETVKGIYLLRRLNKELNVPLHFDVRVIHAAITPADMDGFRELINILKDPKQIEDILTRAYKHVRTLFRAYLQKHNAYVMISFYRKGFKGNIRSKYAARWEKPDTPRYYSGLWRQVVEKIEGPPKPLGPARITSFSLEDLLSVKIPSQRSKFTSIFMMEEFGTGQEADPQLRRPFTSFGSTPFKVPPELAKGSGGERNVQYLWWPRLPWKAYALRLAGAFQKNKNFMLTLAVRERFLKEAQRISNRLTGKKRTFAEMQKWAMQTYRRYERYTKLEKKAEEEIRAKRLPLEVAYGFKRGHKRPGREARHLFFDTRQGIVKEIHEIQEEGQKEVARQIDIKIQKVKKGKFKDFPSVYRILFPGG